MFDKPRIWIQPGLTAEARDFALVLSIRTVDGVAELVGSPMEYYMFSDPKGDAWVTCRPVGDRSEPNWPFLPGTELSDEQRAEVARVNA